VRENFVKRKLKRGNPSIGTWIELGHPDVAEILGKFGFDWVIVDLEHAPISVQTLAVLMQAMGNSPTLPFVRVP
jgi:2-keto-3-deoxy-L-rhamnonate aldolase RhmA